MGSQSIVVKGTTGHLFRYCKLQKLFSAIWLAVWLKVKLCRTDLVSVSLWSPSRSLTQFYFSAFYFISDSNSQIPSLSSLWCTHLTLPQIMQEEFCVSVTARITRPFHRLTQSDQIFTCQVITVDTCLQALCVVKIRSSWLLLFPEIWKDTGINSISSCTEDYLDGTQVIMDLSSVQPSCCSCTMH